MQQRVQVQSMLRVKCLKMPSGRYMALVIQDTKHTFKILEGMFNAL